ncbi:50S ribosomal protein L19 [Patescibacteria group bacterium]
MTTNTATIKEKKDLPLKPGATVKVHEKIKEVSKGKKKGEKAERERIQIFEGIVLAIKHKNETGATITVRKISKGFGVEKIFPIHSPVVQKIEVIKQSKVRQAKLYYLRDYKKKLRTVKK